MKQKLIQDFLDTLFDKKIEVKSKAIGSYKTEAINTDARVIVEQMFRKFLEDNRDEKIGILEAKLFAYEQIISKSNFAPILEETPETP